MRFVSERTQSQVKATWGRGKGRFAVYDVARGEDVTVQTESKTGEEIMYANLYVGCLKVSTSKTTQLWWPVKAFYRVYMLIL